MLLSQTQLGEPISSEKSTYILKKIISSGSTEVVYEALNQKNNQSYSLKIQKEIDSDELFVLSYFQQYQFKYIINVIDVFEWRCFKIIVLELASESLQKFLSNRENQNESRDKIFINICKGIQELHKLNYVHGDVNPENIVKTQDKKLRFKLRGQGYGLIRDSTQKNLIGTPCYMAPELLRESPVKYGTEVDIWAMGCIYHKLITGNHLFDGKSQTEIENKVLRAQHAEINQAIQLLPVEQTFKSVVIQMLNIERSKRPAIKAVLKVFEKKLKPQHCIQHQGPDPRALSQKNNLISEFKRLLKNLHKTARIYLQPIYVKEQLMVEIKNLKSQIEMDDPNIKILEQKVNEIQRRVQLYLKFLYDTTRDSQSDNLELEQQIRVQTGEIDKARQGIIKTKIQLVKQFQDLITKCREPEMENIRMIVEEKSQGIQNIYNFQQLKEYQKEYESLNKEREQLEKKIQWRTKKDTLSAKLGQLIDKCIHQYHLPLKINAQEQIRQINQLMTNQDLSNYKAQYKMLNKQLEDLERVQLENRQKVEEQQRFEEQRQDQLQKFNKLLQKCQHYGELKIQVEEQIKQIYALNASADLLLYKQKYEQLNEEREVKEKKDLITSFENRQKKAEEQQRFEEQRQDYLQKFNKPLEKCQPYGELKIQALNASADLLQYQMKQKNLNQESGFTYQKVVAFNRLEFQQQKWFLTLNAFLKQIQGGLQEKIEEYLIKEQRLKDRQIMVENERKKKFCLEAVAKKLELIQDQIQNAVRSQDYIKKFDQVDASLQIMQIDQIIIGLNQRLEDYQKFITRLKTESNNQKINALIEFHQLEIQKEHDQMQNNVDVYLMEFQCEVTNKLLSEFHIESQNFTDSQSQRFLREDIGRLLQGIEQDWRDAVAYELKDTLIEKKMIIQIQEQAQIQIAEAQTQNQKFRFIIQNSLQELRNCSDEPLDMNRKLRELRQAINDCQTHYDDWNKQKANKIQQKFQLVKQTCSNQTAKASNLKILSHKVKNHDLIKNVLQYRDYFYYKVYQATKKGFTEDINKIVDVDDQAKKMEEIIKDKLEMTEIKNFNLTQNSEASINKAYEDYQNHTNFREIQLLPYNTFKDEYERNKQFNLHVFLDHFDQIVACI